MPGYIGTLDLNLYKHLTLSTSAEYMPAKPDRRSDQYKYKYKDDFGIYMGIKISDTPKTIAVGAMISIGVVGIMVYGFVKFMELLVDTIT